MKNFNYWIDAGSDQWCVPHRLVYIWHVNLWLLIFKMYIMVRFCSDNPMPDRHCSSINIHSLLLCKNSRACCHSVPDSFFFLFLTDSWKWLHFALMPHYSQVCVCTTCVCAHALSVCPSVGGSLVFSLTDAIGLLMYSTHSVTTQGQLLGSIRCWDLTEGCNRHT